MKLWHEERGERETEREREGCFFPLEIQHVASWTYVDYASKPHQAISRTKAATAYSICIHCTVHYRRLRTVPKSTILYRMYGVPVNLIVQSSYFRHSINSCTHQDDFTAFFLSLAVLDELQQWQQQQQRQQQRQHSWWRGNLQLLQVLYVHVLLHRGGVRGVCMSRPAGPLFLPPSYCSNVSLQPAGISHHFFPLFSLLPTWEVRRPKLQSLWLSGSKVQY